MYEERDAKKAKKSWFDKVLNQNTPCESELANSKKTYMYDNIRNSSMEAMSSV